MGGTKQDKAPIGHATASPSCHKENARRVHGHRVHLGVAVTATARQLDKPCDSLAIPQKMKENEKQDFMGVSAICNETYSLWSEIVAALLSAIG